MTESEFKTKLVKIVREQGGYGRRFEDQYAVGIPDTVVILPAKYAPVFFIEAKIIRLKSGDFEPTLRQRVELQRINKVADNPPQVVGMMLGWNPDLNHASIKMDGDDRNLWWHCEGIKEIPHTLLRYYFDPRRKWHVG